MSEEGAAAGRLAWDREDFLDEMALEGTAHLDKWRGEAKHCWWREEQGHELNAENWVACELRNRLIQSRSRAVESREGGAWAGFRPRIMLSPGRDSIHSSVQLEVVKLSLVKGSGWGERNFELHLEKLICPNAFDLGLFISAVKCQPSQLPYLNQTVSHSRH